MTISAILHFLVQYEIYELFHVSEWTLMIYVWMNTYLFICLASIVDTHSWCESHK